MTIAPAPAALRVSLFEHLQQQFSDRLTLINCTKATLVHISHTLEDLVLTRRIPAILFTGFQESSHWREETERYRALAEVAQQVCIFAGGKLPPESSEKEIHVTLQGDDPLRQEWFLCILSPQFSVVLCGQDRQVATGEEATRQFATLWTLDPLVINDVLDKCEAVVAHYRPDRAAELKAARQQFPPAAPDPEIMTLLTMEMIRFEEKLHLSLVRTTQMLEQQLKWQEDMISLLVHDLRSPLQSITLSLQMATMYGEVSDQQRELIGMAQKGAQHAAEMVQMMLDSTKLEYGQFPINIQPLVAQELIEQAREETRSLAHMQGITVMTQLADTVPLIWGDKALLGRVLVNLITNAIKHTPAYGTITIMTALHPDGKQIELGVRDTGRGIPLADQDRIFERLAQVRGEDRKTGAGLGLYFCRLAAEAHKGTIRVNSQLGMGSTFTVTLPLRPILSM
jgi:rsbT co-antagonist protein RsbR